MIDWERYRSRLGTVNDSVIAREVGCSREAVRLARGRMGGIPSNADRRSARSFALAGTMPDADVVAAVGQGVTAANVRTVRRQRGLPAYTKMADPAQHGVAESLYSRGCRCEACTTMNARRIRAFYDGKKVGQPGFWPCPTCGRQVSAKTRYHVDVDGVPCPTNPHRRTPSVIDQLRERHGGEWRYEVDHNRWVRSDGYYVEPRACYAPTPTDGEHYFTRWYHGGRCRDGVDCEWEEPYPHVVMRRAGWRGSVLG